MGIFGSIVDAKHEHQFDEVRQWSEEIGSVSSAPVFRMKPRFEQQGLL
ncbi:hypothetical protein [Haladaptatus sp. NG-SE-30]